MSALAAQPGRIGSRALAIVTALLVALSGLLIVPAAHAADGPTITVTPAENLDPAVDNVLTVTGTGFTGDGAKYGAYVLFGAESIWKGGSPLVSDGWLTQAHIGAGAIENGAFTATVEVPAGTLDPGVKYHVATSAAHMLSVSNRSLDTFFPVTVAQPVVTPTETATTLSASANTVAAGESVTLTAGVTPSEAAGTVTFTDNGAQIGEPQAVAAGVASIVAPELAAGNHSFVAAFVPADGSGFAGSTSAATAVTVTEGSTTPPVEDPKVTADLTDASEAGLKVAVQVDNIALRLAADVPGLAKDDVGVYIGIIDKDRVQDYSKSSSAGAAEAFIFKSQFTGTSASQVLEVPAGKLDRTKQYVAVSWLAHGMLDDSRYLGQADIVVPTSQWDSVFPAQVDVKVADATSKGLSLEVEASGVVLRTGSAAAGGRPDSGVYVGVVAKDRVGDFESSSNAGVAQEFVSAGSISDGKLAKTVTIPADKLERGTQYVVVIWRAHGFLDQDRFVGQADVKLSWSQWVSLLGDAPIPTSVAVTSSSKTVSDGHVVGLTASVSAFEANPEDTPLPIGSVQFLEDGKAFGKPLPVNLPKKGSTASVQIPSPAVADGDIRTYTAAFTPLNEADYAPASSQGVEVAGTAATGPWNPALNVFVKVDGKEIPYTGQKVYRGDEIVVRGTGFDPEENVGGRGMPLPYGPQGTYIVFGNFTADKWQPSQSFASSARKIDSSNQAWLLAETVFDKIPANFKPAVEKQWVKPAADGSFEWSTKLAAPAELAPDGKFGVYSYAAGGVNNANEELEVLVDFVDSARPGNPAIEAFMPDGTPYTNQELREGDKLVIKGTGFDPYANMPPNPTGGMPIPNSLPQGTFVVFGSFAKEWQPSKGAEGSTRAMHKDSRKWALAKDTLEAVPAQFQEIIRKEWAEIDPKTGSFETTVTLHSPEAPLADGSFGIYTYAGGAGQAVNVSQELSVPVNYQAKSTEPEGPEPSVGGLDWAFNTGWNAYVRFIAGGSITGSNGAKTDAAGLTNYTQVKGGNYDPKTGVGTIHYQGTVRYQSNNHGFDIAIKDPRITFTSATAAELSAEISTSDESGVGSMSRVVLATVKPGKGVVADDGLRSWAEATGVFGKLTFPEGWADYSGKATAPLSFSYGSANTEVPVDPEGPGTTPSKPKPKPQPKPKPIGKSNAQQAGSLSWGISSGFKGYVTGRIAKGSISTSGVGANGGAYLFPQAAGGSWNAQSQTGTVQFSGVVTFTGHKGLLSESFANPVLTVNSPTSGTISAGGRSFGLDLGAASKSVGANGEVTWSGVPVSGSISGGGSTGAGAAGSGSFGADPLSFTVGVPSSVQYGSTTQSEQKAEREPAASAPTTEGIRVITPKEDIVPGGQIEFVAPGFESNERDVLVVLYSDPVVLDKKAGANEFGEVRWIGTIPEDTEPGEHTITLQGSTDAGAKITVVDPDKKKTKKQDKPVVKKQTPESATTQSAALLPESGDGPVWLWWVGAGGLLVLAAALTGLVVSQRRAAANANVDAGSGS